MFLKQTKIIPWTTNQRRFVKVNSDYGELCFYGKAYLSLYIFRLGGSLGPQKEEQRALIQPLDYSFFPIIARMQSLWCKPSFDIDLREMGVKLSRRVQIRGRVADENLIAQSVLR
jgi:hypothetical protein